MPRYEVIVTQYHSYEVEADDEYEARELGVEDFKKDMRRPIANTWYNEVDVEEIEGDEE